jgi:uncharacterized protein (TIGR01777 family)
MRVLITGGTGLVGRRLVVDRLDRGDVVRVVTRSAARAAEILPPDRANLEIVSGDPRAPGPWQKAVDGCDAVVQLAGAGVADRRWSAARKRVIVRSRIDSTHQLVEAFDAAANRPSVLVGASAVGWYGDTGDRETSEDAEPAVGDFFGDLVVRWEREAARAASDVTRVVHARIGLVLDVRGGLLRSLLRPFRLCVGGPIGRGRQYMPWIHWRDLVGLVDHVLGDAAAQGPFNCTAPNPVTNRDFSRALGRALGRPSVLPVPGFALRLALGEFARYAMMSQRVVPSRALASGYVFTYPEIGSALASLLSGTACG